MIAEQPRPHPRNFTVEIKQLPEGTWRLQIAEAPAFWGEGSTLTAALDALRKRALTRAENAFGAEEIVFGAAAAFAAESAVENYGVLKEDDPAADDEPGESASWDDVSVISRGRRARIPPRNDS